MEQIILLIWISNIVAWLRVSLAVIVTCAAIILLIIALVRENWRFIRMMSWLLIPYTVAILLPSHRTMGLTTIAYADVTLSNAELSTRERAIIRDVLDVLIKELDEPGAARERGYKE